MTKLDKLKEIIYNDNDSSLIDWLSDFNCWHDEGNSDIFSYLFEEYEDEDSDEDIAAATGKYRKIKCNKAKCLTCGEIIESKSVHDWVACKCFDESDGKTGIFVDGGKEYLRRGGDIENYVELSEYYDE